MPYVCSDITTDLLKGPIAEFLVRRELSLTDQSWLLDCVLHVGKWSYQYSVVMCQFKVTRDMHDWAIGADCLSNWSMQDTLLLWERWWILVGDEIHCLVIFCSAMVKK